MTKRAFVVGHPIAHSRSPLIHSHWLDAYGIDGTYERVDVHPDDFGAFLDRVRAGAFVGGNVTIPHKEAAFRLADTLSPRAKAIGAVNTLVRQSDGRLLGDNTDAPGFIAHLDRSLGPDWPVTRGDRGLVLGAGGAARAIVVGLLERGLSRIAIANRTRERAQILTELDPNRVHAIDWAELPARLGETDLLVNTTALGMAGHPHLDLDLSPLPAQAAVADIVYVPLETALLAAARRRGLAAVDGLGMLLHQAVPGFEAWFGRCPEVTPDLRARLVADLTRRMSASETPRRPPKGGPTILGLTGSIGMGKSATARMFAEAGIPVHDSDASVHALYGPDGAAARAIGTAFPGTLDADGAVDRALLREAVLDDPDAMRRLESLVHPLVQAESRAFLARHASAPLVVLDIPLLFETGAEARCHAVAVVTAPPEVQRQRVLARPGMSEASFNSILAKQMPDDEKRARADVVIDTSRGFDHARSEVAALIAQLTRAD